MTKNELDYTEDVEDLSLSTEERYRQAVQEAKELGEQLQEEKKAQEDYEMGRTMGLRLMAVIEGLMDAGLSRKEAFSMIKFSRELV